MKKNSNKNYTLYWMTGISAALTIPVAVIIVNSINAGIVAKTVMIMAVFLVLLIAVMILYKSIFGVTVKEITQDEKVTELDRLNYTLEESRKKHTNLQIIKCIDTACEQIQRFKRRKDVMLQIAGIDPGSNDSSVLADLVQTVENAIVIIVEKLLNQVIIFDDQGIPELIRQNIEYIEQQLHKNNEILKDFEKLITETSRMGEIHEEKDISKLRDVINAMQSLRTEQDDDIDTLAKKYETGREK